MTSSTQGSHIEANRCFLLALAYSTRAMRNFDQRGGSRGGFKSGGSRGFGRLKFGGDRDRRGGDRDRGPVTMHKATCATCGESCEVPFRPSGDKPVYCSGCFRAAQDGGERGDRAPRKEFGRPSFTKSPDYRNSGGSDNKREFETINTKLDKLTTSINRLVDVLADNKSGINAENKSEKVVKKPSAKKPTAVRKSIKQPKKS